MPTRDELTTDGTGEGCAARSPSVTVVIATAARPARAQTLRRAIESAFDQDPRPHVIVVVNGQGYDRSLFESLRADERIELHHAEIGSYPAAQRFGRSLVQTPFFCFLDDDDELLPGSIGKRLARALRDDAPDVVVSNGYRHTADGDRPIYPPPLPDASSDLLTSLLSRNWFPSCGPLLRSARVGSEYFDGTSSYFEWTLIGYRLLLDGRRIAFIDDVCFRVNDSAVSLSKDDASVFMEPEVLASMIGMGPPPHVRRLLSRRLASAHHACADLALRKRDLATAWRHHFRCLSHRGGVSYLPFTRRLVAAALTTRRAR